MTAAAATVAIGVFPGSELERRRALFSALELAFPVRFSAREPGALGDLGGLLELGGRAEAEAASAAGIPALALLNAEADQAGEPATQALTAASELDRRLWGALLPDSRLEQAQRRAAGLDDPGSAIVLASSSGAPTWVRAGQLDTALLCPAELAEAEALRERLCLERSAALLPVVHFLRERTESIAWRPPPARSSLLFDDPNLHWPSYGFLGLHELAEHARAHRYHAALATVPLDTWFAHPKAVRIVKGSAGTISLLVHGNDHNGGELGHPQTEAEGLTMAAQALRRVRAFASRTGVPVDEVMVPPHEQCAEPTVSGLLRSGFTAVTMTRPFPWLSQPPRSWLTRPAGADPLVGWRPADFAGAMPVLSRHPLAQRDGPELVLRAFLDQPLILYGHHEDVAAGLGGLAAAVEDVNRVRESRWCSIGEIASANFETRHEGSRLDLRPYSRRVEIEVPPDVGQLSVVLPDAHPGAALERLSVAGAPAEIGEPVDVDAGERVRVELHAHDEVDPATVPSGGRQPLAVARRALGEGRDRLQPLLGRLR